MIKTALKPHMNFRTKFSHNEIINELFSIQSSRHIDCVAIPGTNAALNFKSVQTCMFFGSILFRIRNDP